MDKCTVMQFHNAMLHPEECLRRYHELRFEPDTLVRTKYFAQCRARLNDRSVMVYAPITSTSMTMINNTLRILPAKSMHINPIEVVDDEILCSGLVSHRCSLIIETLPEGKPLSEVIYTHTNSHLSYGLEELREELAHHNISINHLHTDTIIVDRQHHWHVIRPFYASAGKGRDIEAFHRLKKLIDRCSLSDLEDEGVVMEGFAPYGTTPGKTEHLLYEGLRRIYTEQGVGFEDEWGNVVVEAKYLRASNFMEDRSVVESLDHKMGIIDRRGRYIIPTEYDHVEFDVDHGISRVIDGTREARFDYFGKQISDWKTTK